MDNWIKKVFSEYIKLRGAFVCNEDNLLEEKDFLNIYDTIESLSRFQLRVHREEHAKLRIEKFNKLFFKKHSSDAEKKMDTVAYVTILLE